MERADGNKVTYKPHVKLSSVPIEDLNGILMFSKRTDQHLLQRYRNDYAELYCTIIEDLQQLLEDKTNVPTNEQLMEPLIRLHILPNLVFRRFNGKEEQQALEIKIRLLANKNAWKHIPSTRIISHFVIWYVSDY